MKNINKICCIFNYAPHYRAPIYILMDRKLHCDFYFVMHKTNPFKMMKYEGLKGFKKILRYVPIHPNFHWQKGAISLVFKPYRQFVLTGRPTSISTWIILIVAKILGKKTYLWTHGWYGDETRLKKIVKKIFFKLSHSVLLYGDYSRNLMIKEGFPTHKLVCIYNSLDYDKQIEARKKLIGSSIYQDYFQNNYPTLLYVGRIQNVKKIDLLIEALNTLSQEGVYCNLVVIGPTIEDESIKELVDSYKLIESVWFYGECYEEEKLGELIYNADVCVSPGNVGLTVMHCLVYGTPVITHNNSTNQMPEFEAIEQGVTGDFFEEGSVTDLCDKIKTWISIPLEQRDIVRRKCYKIIDERYNPHKQIDILLNTLR